MKNKDKYYYNYSAREATLGVLSVKAVIRKKGQDRMVPGIFVLLSWSFLC